jgi:hypothetical protein
MGMLEAVQIPWMVTASGEHRDGGKSRKISVLQKPGPGFINISKHLALVTAIEQNGFQVLQLFKFIRVRFGPGNLVLGSHTEVPKQLVVINRINNRHLPAGLTNAEHTEALMLATHTGYFGPEHFGRLIAFVACRAGFDIITLKGD